MDTTNHDPNLPDFEIIPQEDFSSSASQDNVVPVLDFNSILFELKDDERKLLLDTPELIRFLELHGTHLAGILCSDLVSVTRCLVSISVGRPKGWTGFSAAPYYKEKFALMVKGFIDDFYASDCKPRLWVAKDKNPRTLYLMFNHGWHYIIDKMSSETKYTKLLELARISVYSERGQKGILLQKSDSLRAARELANQAEAVTSVEDSWRTKLDNFLSDDSKSPADIFKVTNILFAPEDIDYVRNLAAEWTDYNFNMAEKYLAVKNTKVSKPVVLDKSPPLAPVTLNAKRPTGWNTLFKEGN